IALAACLFAYHGADSVLLYGRCEKFCGAYGISVCQNRHRQADALVVRIVLIGISVLVGHAYYHSLGQELIEHFRHDIGISSAVYPDIEDEGLGSCVHKALKVSFKLLLGSLVKGVDP